MSQSIARIWIHLIFSTKNRHPFLRSEKVRSDTHAYLSTIGENLGCPVRITNGTADHVHLLCLLGRTMSVGDLVKKLKNSSTPWLQKRRGMLSKFRWQGGYAAFSVSPSQLEYVYNYIACQEEHHRNMTFQEELLEILRRHEADFDEQYLWE